MYNLVTDKGSLMSYLPKDERRADLVRAAVRVLARDGLSAVTTRAVAAEAGVSAGLVSHRFSGAAELVAEAWLVWVGSESDAFVAVGREPGPTAAAAFFDSFDRPDGALDVWADAWRYAQTERAFAPAFTQSFALLVEALASCLGGGAAAQGAATRLLLLAFGLAAARQISPGLVAAPAVVLREAIERELSD